MAVQHCPSCGQLVQVYRRTIRRTALATLHELFNRFGTAYAKTADLTTSDGGGDFAKLRYWGLIEESLEAPAHWRITQTGIAFLEGRQRVKKYVWLFDGRPMPDDPSVPNPLIGIDDIASDLRLMSKATALERSTPVRQYVQRLEPDLFSLDSLVDATVSERGVER